jgi:hypothetical protein
MANTTKEQKTKYIELILDRVDTMRDWLPSYTPKRFDLFFALIKAKLTKPQLEKLYHSNEPSFGHDVFGIHEHTDITKGLDKTFVPRCTCGNDFY